jgi:putative transposase
MSRQPRNGLPDGVFHVTAHSVFGLELFVDDQDRYVFLWLLGELTERFAIRCLAYCLMGTHYHLLVEGATVDLDAAPERALCAPVQRAPRTQRASVRRAVSARVIVDELHLGQAYAYLEANPAKAGLCDAGVPWPWVRIEARGREDGRHGRVPAPRSPARPDGSDRLKPVTALTP